VFPPDAIFPDGAINWNDGRRISLSLSQTAICTALAPGQLYAVFFYNSSSSAQNVRVNVVWSNSNLPHEVTIPGTEAGAGLASLCFVCGDDTRTVSVSINGSGIISAGDGSAPSIDCWIGSLRMPTNTAGIVNQPLVFDGTPRDFGRAHRYFSVPRSKWYAVQVTTGLSQFTFVQFWGQYAMVFVLNTLMGGLIPGQITGVGKAETDALYAIKLVRESTITFNLQGDGQQWVWMNASSTQDSEESTISGQSL
jgi:hypothetical protein